MIDAVERYFGLREADSTWGTEVRAGLTTFVTMAYILFVNPSILGDAISLQNQEFAQLLTATAIAAAFGTAVMGIVARYPFALAPGMGLNAYFAYTVVLGQGLAWETALGAVFLSGLLFIALSLGGVRDAILRAIPIELRYATAAGIGLFLALIGAKNAGIVVDHHVTLVTLGDPTSAGVLLCVFGLVVIAALRSLDVPGAILLGIGATSVAAIWTGAPVFNLEPFPGLVNGVVEPPAWPVELWGKLDIAGAWGMGVLGIVFTFTFVDLFDTAGTLFGLADRGGFTDDKGDVPRATAAFTADAVATTAGAALGTSSTTSYIESMAGIAAGGRTGITALVVALCFALSIFFWPLAAAVPQCATAPALILVGASMMGGLNRIDWDVPHIGLPAFVTVLGMPFTFSIANGISFGIIAWTAIHLLSGRGREVHLLMYVLSVVLLVRYGWLAGG